MSHIVTIEIRDAVTVRAASLSIYLLKTILLFSGKEIGFCVRLVTPAY
ncbi:MAG: hypothetical protein IH987_17890 [Planctomycetes bacterium]|nr:hypothetical protein [Planctomycetota bacterium]